ncbi:MAG TPA: proprotein convertase P-domain-containing protein [Kofleriaceae bacterium]|nr:proprotein convertase P-domain-containing protein [Kofleriaceae bacterium]
MVIRPLAGALLLAIAAGCAQGADKPDARVFDAQVFDAREFPDAVQLPDGMVVTPPDAAIGLDAAGPACATTTADFTNSTSTPIPDLDTLTSTLDVTGLPTFLGKLTVTTHITHQYPPDLEILLITPTGARVRLTADNGEADNSFDGTVWTDAADANAIDYLYLTTPATELAPETPLGALFGSDPNGTWTLSVLDDAGSDTGTLASWTLSFTTFAQTPDLELLSVGSSTSHPINDNSTVSDALNLGSIGMPICKVAVTTQIQHTFAGDLLVSLIDPAAHRIKLSEYFGTDYDDVFLGTQWRDDAGDSVTDHSFASDGVVTPLAPYYGLGAEFGNDAAGTWTLEVHDDAGSDVGSLQGWTLDLTGCSCP